MRVASDDIGGRNSGTRRGSLVRRAVLSLFLFVFFSGCAAVTNPVGEAVPVRLVPPELLAPPRLDEHALPLTLLGQPRPDAYRLAGGDVLGLYIERVLGDRTMPIPLHVSPPVQLRDQRRLTPSSGHPIEVQPDGTLDLPLVSPLRVAGLTVPQAAEAIRRHYADKQLIKLETDRVLVTLLQARQHQVLVFRQESPAFTVGTPGIVSSGKRGTGHVVDLAAYENDVAHALAVTGGLPGLDAYNEIIIFRGWFGDSTGRALLHQQLEATPDGKTMLTGGARKVIRIPLRLPPGVAPPFCPEDVVLQTGDVVYLEARDADLFYTGGLLPSAVHILPRDVDVDVLEAVVRVGGPLFNGAFGGSNLSGALIQPGIGNPSPTHLVVVRKTPGGGQVAIEVDLRQAMRDPGERIRVMPGDLLVLQEKPGEALSRYFSQTFLNFNLAWEAVRSQFTTGIVDISGADRLPDRLVNVNINKR